MFKLWYSVIWEINVLLVWRLLEIHLLERKPFLGEFLINAQGEDVVAGTRTPQHITKAKKDFRCK